MQVEMILQASEYEAAQGKQLQEFFDSTAGKWRTELGRSWAEEVYRRRAVAAAPAACGERAGVPDSS
jgi:putative hydrolase of HD superfamily